MDPYFRENESSEASGSKIWHSDDRVDLAVSEKDSAAYTFAL